MQANSLKDLLQSKIDDLEKQVLSRVNSIEEGKPGLRNETEQRGRVESTLTSLHQRITDLEKGKQNELARLGEGNRGWRLMKQVQSREDYEKKEKCGKIQSKYFKLYIRFNVAHKAGATGISCSFQLAFWQIRSFQTWNKWPVTVICPKGAWTSWCAHSLCFFSLYDAVIFVFAKEVQKIWKEEEALLLLWWI